MHDRLTAEIIDRIKVLHQVPQVRNLLRLGSLIGLYVVLYLIGFSFDLWAVLVVAPVMGVILTGLLNVAHDCVHLRFSGNRRLDSSLGKLLCAPLLINFQDFRQAHLKHHKHTRTTNDTEWTGVFMSRSQYLRYLLLVNPLRGQLRIWTPSKLLQPGTVIVIGTQVGLLVLAMFNPAVAVIGWFIPFVLGHIFIRFFSLPEHYGLGECRDVEVMTRSVRSLPVLRFLLWEASFHAEHHRWPGVPSLNLPALHELEVLPLANISDGYVRFHYELFKSLSRPHGP